MDISKYICDYLVEYNTSVVIPQLGCFTIVNIPSEIRDGMVTPPCKTVKLDSDMSNDDFVFTLYVARKEDISTEQAAEEIRNFYDQNFVEKLSVDQSITIERLGTFSLNESQKIVFEPDANLFKTNFGLDNAYFSFKAPEPPTWNPVVTEPPISNPVVPEPIHVSEPIHIPEPEPIYIPEPEPIQTPEPEIKTTMDTQTNPEESLFDTNNNVRYRENTTRREQTFENQRPPVKTTQKPISKRPKQKEKTKDSNLWLLWVLLIAVVLGVAGYFLYQKFFSSSSKTSVVTIVDEETPIINDEIDESTPNTDIAQTLDDATDKKNALKPENNQQKPSIQPSAPSSVSRGAVGRGTYGIIVASLGNREDAEDHGKNLNKKYGYNYEIIEAVVHGVKRYRVSVDSFDDWKDWRMYVDKWKNQPGCKDAWAVKK